MTHPPLDGRGPQSMEVMVGDRDMAARPRSDGPARISGLYTDNAGSIWFCRQHAGQTIVVCNGRSGKARHYYTAADPATFAAWGWTPMADDTDIQPSPQIERRGVGL